MGFFIFRKVKKKRKLYRAYLEKKVMETQKAFPEGTKNINKAKHKNTIDGSKKLVERATKLTIAIAGIDDKCGCTYIAEAFAKYLKTELKQSVCIVNMGRKESLDQEDIFTFTDVNINSLHDKYRYLIFDIGNLNNRNKNEARVFESSNIKILLSKNDESFLRRLYFDIIKNQDNLDGWNFMFNQVSQNEIRKIRTLMEDYKYCCVPTFNKENPGIQVNRIFYDILK